VTGRELHRWASLHERRARTGGVVGSPIAIALGAGGALAGWVAWRLSASPAAASHAWLAGALVAFALAFMRVPFHLYWRPDAALLAQLPIDGGPLFDAALWRCVRAAAATTFAVLVGAAPLVQVSGEMFVRHAAVAAALGLAAALFMPAVATFAASLVAVGQTDRIQALRVAAGIDGERRPPATAQAPAPSTAALGALPGFASTLVIVGVLLIASWLTGGTPAVAPAIVLAAIAGTSIVSIALSRASAGRVMGTILRDVSALDRQRLATLEIRPPTAIERAVAGLLGDGALPYTKDARLMRRRYPMAFALGALVFLVLAIVGLARPDDPASWLTATLVSASAYGIALSGRLHRAPIELPRLSRSLPITVAARHRAKLAWVLSWWLIFVAVPGAFAVLRQPDPGQGLALLGGGTVAVVVAALLRSRKDV
jgi:hypothetical protein